MSENYYDILGIDKNADETEIKKAYRKLAQQHHPDRNEGDKASEEKFKKINEAYETLSDKQKKANYDQFGSASGAGFNGFGGQGFSGDFNMGGFQDIFETFFGGNGSGRRTNRTAAKRGNDLESAIQISFEEAAFGVEKELKINKMANCSHCHGKGAEPGTEIIDCDNCSGTGEIMAVRQTLLGQVRTVQTCPNCQGSGKIAKTKCSVCHGKTRLRENKTLNIKIPAGISDGATLKISKEGDSGVHGGENGNLYLHINVAEHEFYEREGSDINLEQKIHLVQAVLGDQIEVPTLHGPVTLKIPAGTHSKQTFRLRGYGIQKLNKNERGDQYVTVEIVTPQKLSKKEKELYEELADLAGLKDNSKPKDRSFLKKLLG